MGTDLKKYGRTFEKEYSHFGSDTYGHDVKAFGATTGKYIFWDASADTFYIAGTLSYTGAVTTTGNTQFTGTVTVGVNDTGYDVKFFGDTASCYMLWDASADSLIISETLATNPGAAVIPFNVTINHSAGAGDCNDLVVGYFKANVTGDGDSGLTSVALASRAYVGATGTDTTVASACYGVQPWAKHDGTGAITAMSAVSALVDVNTGNFTASTVNAGHFHIEGAATVTAQFDGVMIEVYPDVTCLDSALAIAIDSGGVCDAAIRLSGATATDFLKFAATGTCGATTSDPGVGAANTWIKCHIGSTIFWLIGYADS